MIDNLSIINSNFHNVGVFEFKNFVKHLLLVNYQWHLYVLKIIYKYKNIYIWLSSIHQIYNLLFCFGRSFSTSMLWWKNLKQPGGHRQINSCIQLVSIKLNNINTFKGSLSKQILKKSSLSLDNWVILMLRSIHLKRSFITVLWCNSWEIYFHLLLYVFIFYLFFHYPEWAFSKAISTFFYNSTDFYIFLVIVKALVYLNNFQRLLLKIVFEIC